MPSEKDYLNMTEDDIEKLLSEGMESANKEEKEVRPEEDISDLMDLLSKDEDSELQEIHDILQKSDNNEALSDDILAQLQETPDEQNDLLEQIMKGTEETVESAQQADERKIKRDKRKAEKQAQKEAKKAAKLESKAAKEAEKKAKKKTQDVKNDDLADIDELISEADNPMRSVNENASDGMDISSMFGEDNTEQRETEGSKQSDNVQLDPLDDKNANQKPRKKNVFSRFVNFLTEEDVDENAAKTASNEEIQLSDENKNILNELDKDKGKKKKSKKGQKTKKGDSEKDNAEGKKDKKPKKEKKPKAEKIPKEVIAEEGESSGSRHKLSMKKILPIALVCLSLGAVIILVSELAGDYSTKRLGREAYYSGDYQTCYQNLYGKELNESEQIMYSKSESILRIRLWIREYELLAEEGAEAEALDSLIQSVNAYPVLYAYAGQWNAGIEVEVLYGQILDILSNKYHLTEEQVLEIAATRDDVDYSKMVYAIVDGEAFGSWNQPKEQEPEILPDVLPEEEELGDIPFVDNNNNQ